ncbi:MAG: Dna[CI] antecedent, DciA [Thermoleophilia bacterium]|nr:Dna[CI] antecedent, DciA [Thermoleophilia bacterium]MCZ4495954.1 Dna[CI] antecedent, DciA [Thermoleophilia bacterium]
MAKRPEHSLIDAAGLSGRQLDEVAAGFGRIVRAFAETIGEDMAKVATATRLRNGELTVRCASSTWAQTIGFMELELIDRLRTNYPKLEIVRIRAVAGGIAPPPPPPPAALPMQPLDAAAEARLQALVAHITEPTLRARVLAAATASERRRVERVNPAR